MPSTSNNTEAQTFLTRGAEVIVRMRGLPYAATAAQILEFFRSGEQKVEVMDGEEGILFVNKVDGTATGDAFVLFRTEEDASVALSKHKENIGSRYIELFRSTTAEVQQVINKSMEPPKPEVTSNHTPGLIGAMPGIGGMAGLTNAGAMLPQQLVISGQKKDCIRLRGLPYEAQVQHILDFLGEYAKHIVFQGVHMVYNAQGHPSGEAFIQMDGEPASVATATERHNKYMHIGKKQRYIEVFQCSADDMNLVLTGPTAAAAGNPGAAALLPQLSAASMGQRQMISPGGGLLHNFAGGLSSPTAAMTAPSHLNQQSLINAQLLSQLGMTAGLQNGYSMANPGGIPGLMANIGGARVPYIPGLTGVVPVTGSQGGVIYWPYPSPPVSPTNYYAAAQSQAAAMAAAQTQAVNVAQQGPAVVLIRGLPFNTTTADIMAFFHGYSELAAELIQIHRTATGQPTGDALVTFGNRSEAERAVMEKNRQLLCQRPVDLFICSI